jgi:hypothetical protein
MRPLIALILMPLLAGCGVELLATTATVGELQAQQLKSVRGQVQAVGESQGRINLQRAIDTYSAEKGVYPRTLDELAPGYIAAVPVHADGSAYGYDPATGRLSDGPAAGVSDAQQIAQIQAAITRYGTATGFYPPTLQDLVPQYLPAVPLSASGQAYIYDNQNGYVAAPAQYGSPAPAGYVPVGGGPMGEVMTGIGIQQQLGNMNNSGTSAAGSNMRRGLGSATSDHNAQQEQALKAMGY